MEQLCCDAWPVPQTIDGVPHPCGFQSAGLDFSFLGEIEDGVGKSRSAEGRKRKRARCIVPLQGGAEIGDRSEPGAPDARVASGGFDSSFCSRMATSLHDS